MTVLEICLDDLDGVAVAEAAGADRVELCAALSEGGLTPSIGTVTAALAMARHLGVQVLVRQRAGDFVYSRVEIDAMVGHHRDQCPAATTGGAARVRHRRSEAVRGHRRARGGSPRRGRW